MIHYSGSQPLKASFVVNRTFMHFMSFLSRIVSAVVSLLDGHVFVMQTQSPRGLPAGFSFLLFCLGGGGEIPRLLLT